MSSVREYFAHLSEMRKWNPLFERYEELVETVNQLFSPPPSLPLLPMEGVPSLLLRAAAESISITQSTAALPTPPPKPPAGMEPLRLLPASLAFRRRRGCGWCRMPWWRGLLWWCCCLRTEAPPRTGDPPKAGGAPWRTEEDVVLLLLPLRWLEDWASAPFVAAAPVASA